MTGLVSKVLFMATVIVECYGAVDITKYFKVCNRNSEDLNDCMVKAVEKGLKTMANGVPEMGLPPLDPFLQKELKLEYNNNQILAKMHIQNIYVEGLKDATVHGARVKADDDLLLIEIDLKADRVFVKGTYEGKGQYNALKLDARGEFNTTMGKLEWTWKLEGTPIKVGSETFVRIHSLYMRPDVETMVSHLSNDNPDSKYLTDLGNRFMNDNWRVLYGELVPFAQANWNKTGIKVANKIFMKIPYDQVLPIST